VNKIRGASFLNIVLTGILLSTALQGFAQQKPHYTQYIMNQYVLNPALSGIENYVDVKVSHRHQWVGLQDAPLTTYLTIQGPIGKADSRVSATGVQPLGYNPRGADYWANYSAAPPHHGVGLQVIQDVTGPLSRSSVAATYAYHLGLSPRTSLSAGFGLGVSRLSLNTAKLQFDQPNDPSIVQNSIIDRWKPDLSAGLYLYSADFFVGLSAQQIMPQRLEFSENALRKEDGKLVPHLFATAGYRLLVGEDFNLTPSIMLKYLSPLPIQAEVNAKLQYRDAAWLGASWRAQDGYAAMVGVMVGSKFSVGYSYDYTTSRLNAFSRGTHEVMIGFLLNNNFGETCPRNIW
jgi:type IX secretion system PorP/SprF family membrane protein